MNKVVIGCVPVPLDAVRAEAAKAIGRPLVIEYGSARGNLKEMIAAGAAFEVLPVERDPFEPNLRNVTRELQVPVVVTATISTNTSDAATARALLTFLQRPAIEPALRGNGFSC